VSSSPTAFATLLHQLSLLFLTPVIFARLSQTLPKHPALAAHSHLRQTEQAGLEKGETSCTVQYVHTRSSDPIVCMQVNDTAQNFSFNNNVSLSLFVSAGLFPERPLTLCPRSVGLTAALARFPRGPLEIRPTFGRRPTARNAYRSRSSNV